jgi:hypothetical protein
MAIWPEYDGLTEDGWASDWWFNDPFFNRPSDVTRGGLQNVADQTDSRQRSDAEVQALINQGYRYQNGTWVAPSGSGLLDEIENLPNTGITEEFEQPTYVEDEELLDEVLSQGPRADETFDEYMNRVANIGWETRGGGGGISAEDGPSSQQMNSGLGGMAGNPPELGEEEEDEWVWNGTVLVNTSTGEKRSVPNPGRLVTGGTYTGDAELIEAPDEAPVDDIPSSVLGDFIDPSLVINIPSSIPSMNGMGSSGGQIGSSGGTTGGSSTAGGSGSGSSSSGSSSGSGFTGGLTTGQPPAESGSGTGAGSGSGSGSGAGSGTGSGSGTSSSPSQEQPSTPSTPIADSLFGSRGSESSDLFPYTVINPSRAANLGGLLDYVAAINQRRIR